MYYFKPVLHIWSCTAQWNEHAYRAIPWRRAYRQCNKVGNGCRKHTKQEDCWIWSTTYLFQRQIVYHANEALAFHRVKQNIRQSSNQWLAHNGYMNIGFGSRQANVPCSELTTSKTRLLGPNCTKEWHSQDESQSLAWHTKDLNPWHPTLGQRMEVRKSLLSWLCCKKYQSKTCPVKVNP